MDASLTCVVKPTPDGWGRVAEEDVSRVNDALLELAKLRPQLMRISIEPSGSIKIELDRCHVRIDLGTYEACQRLVNCKHVYANLSKQGTFVVVLYSTREERLQTMALHSTPVNMDNLRDELRESLWDVVASASALTSK